MLKIPAFGKPRNVSCYSNPPLKMTLKPKTTKLLTIVGLSISILIASYCVRMVWWAVYWFERDIWLFYPTLVLPFMIPFLIIYIVKQKFIRVISVITGTIVLLTFIYGLHFVGFTEMVRSYDDVVILQSIALIIISIILMNFSREKHYNG